ncbi:type II toxin-antitoxin system VapC family toxin [Sphingomonas sp. AAP5]|uniref:type II toxin-antitoxin system VapC family toxin n=1 Tax=unclassified Sphingomonas TaxID=196159 RepID=UPI001057108B|nr:MULTISPECIES: type II toxin-antitoxin system VapC family toxin [unclassified Sphingomonas]MDY7525407.1 type II toxin-antitoxin system VapC family toxin [Sphingomonas sp. 10B4]MEB0282926.1 type II toxin-antitoxin system VapC family toxin [Sphingomonas sp. 10B4]QBM75732.1 type II toxin-antitoxin system VapC family toxin [Sphingomonas sp. AAP5]
MSATSFDSNILIDALNGNVSAQLELESVDDRWISRVTWIEVMSRVDQITMPRTKSLLAGFLIDELDIPIATRAAELRNECRLKLADSVILASAQVHGRILVTRNTKDFPATMPGIRIPYTL